MATSVRQMPLVCPGHNRGIVELQYSPPTPGGTFLISACLDGTPMLRDGVSGDWIGSFVGHKGAVWGACISSDASLAATAGADFTARLWDAETGECKAVLTQPHICKSTAFSPDGSRLLTAGNTPDIRIYDVASGDTSPIALLSRSDGNKKSSVKVARYAGDSSNVVISASSSPSDEQVVSVWDVRSGKLEKKLPLGAIAKSAELSMDGQYLTVTADDASVSVFSLATMERVMRLPVPRETESASFRYPKMDMVVTGGHDLTVRRYEVLSHDKLKEAESNRGHHGPVWVVRFAPDGESYASGSDDGTIRLWRTTIDPSLAVGGGV